MKYEDRLNLEIIFGGLIDNNIKTADALTEYAEELHDLLENAIQDYAYDNDIDDYMPVY